MWSEFALADFCRQAEISFLFISGFAAEKRRRQLFFRKAPPFPKSPKEPALQELCRKAGAVFYRRTKPNTIFFKAVLPPLPEVFT